MTETIPEVLRAIGAACDYLELDTLNEPEAVEIMTDLTSASEAVTLMLDALRGLLLDVYAAEENEDGERVCAICRRPDYLGCNPDESCDRAREAIRTAEGEAVNG